MDQSNLLENMVKFNNKSEPKAKEVNDKKQNTLYKDWKLTLNVFNKRNTKKGL